MLLFGLRLGRRPRACITTTPRPIKLLKELIANPRTVITRGSTYDNRANLSPEWFEHIISQYEGTRLGRQELWAELLDDHPGALWKLGQVDAQRVREAPELVRIVVAIDPATTSDESSNETGMIVAGVGPCNCKGPTEMHGFVMRDASRKYTPAEWGQEAVSLYNRYEANGIIGETNNGGDLVERNIRVVDRSVAYRGVHASRGKYTRAEPVATLYERGMVHHVGSFPKLEDQLTTWDPEAGMPSPDRLDALVWAITDLMVDRSSSAAITLPDLTGASNWVET
jgi:phage terminase large subunit-like protein